MDELTKEEKIFLYQNLERINIYQVIRVYDKLKEISDSPKKEFLRLEKLLGKPIDWKLVSTIYGLSDNFIKDFKDKLDMKLVIRYNNNKKEHLLWGLL